MNEFQAIMGLCNLKDVSKRMKKREKIYERYKKELSVNPRITFQKITTSKYNYSYMPICFTDKKTRDFVFSTLVKNNIKPRKYFYPLTTESDFSKKDKCLPIDLLP